jgi:hypothetical protein
VLKTDDSENRSVPDDCDREFEPIANLRLRAGRQLPVIQIFWLTGLADAFGLPVAVDGGVDAFSLVPPTALGAILTLVRYGISLAVQYTIACALVTGVSKVRST